MLARRLLVVPASAIAAVALIAGPADAAATKTVASPAALVYVSNHGDYDLWTVNADGSGKAQLTHSSTTTTTAWNSAKTEWAPAFSPDRQWLAYQSSRAGTPDVVIRNVRTGEYRTLAATSASEAPAGWYQAADGLRVAFVVGPATGGGPYALWSVRTDGTDAVQLIDGSRDARSFAATATTAYASLLDADGATRVYSFSTGTPVGSAPDLAPVTVGPNDSNLAVSPAGDLIFDRTVNGTGELWALPAGGPETTSNPAHLLVHKGVWASNPEVSPQGTMLAFASNPDGAVAHGDVYVAPLTGSGATLAAGLSKLVVGDSTYQDSQPTWSR